jgi:hypothetical protein
LEREKIKRLQSTSAREVPLEDATDADVREWLNYSIVIRLDHNTFINKAGEKIVNHRLEIRVKTPSEDEAQALRDKHGSTRDKKVWVIHSRGRNREFLKKMNAMPEVQQSLIPHTIKLAFKVLAITDKKPKERAADWKQQLSVLDEQLKKAIQWKGV